MIHGNRTVLRVASSALKRACIVPSAALIVACGASSTDAWDDDDVEPADTTLGGEADVGQVTQPLSTVMGTRPLLVILLQKDANTPLAHDNAWYTQRIFGPGFQNLRDYVSATSKTRFRYSNAGVLSVVDRTNANFLRDSGANQVKGNDATRRRALWLARRALFPFSNFDTNGDGDVTTDELAVLAIDNYSSGSGQNGNPGCWKHPGANVCVDVALAGHQSELVNYFHELSHQYGTIDLYGGPWNAPPCHSRRNTIMSCTAGGGDGSRVYNIDPWHRDRLGWSVSGVIGNTGASGSAKLQLVSTLSSPFGNAGVERIVINRSGSNESLILEYRQRNTTYDRDIGARGVVPWYVATSSPGNLETIPSVTTEGAEDRANFLLAPQDCVFDPSDPASRGLWGPIGAGQSYRFRWLDGKDSGLRITAGEPASDNTVLVTWTRTSASPQCGG